MGFVVVVNTMTKNNMGRKHYLLAYRLQSSSEEVKAAGAKQRPQRNAVDQLCAGSVTPPRPLCPEMASLTAVWTCPHQAGNAEKAPQTYSQAKLLEAVPEPRLSLPRCANSTGDANDDRRYIIKDNYGMER